MRSAQSKSNVKIIGFAIIAVAVLVIVGGAGYAVYRLSDGTKKDAETSNTPKVSNEDGKEVTQQTLSDGMTNVNDAVKESQDAHEQAKKTIEDPAKRVKVSE